MDGPIWKSPEGKAYRDYHELRSEIKANMQNLFLEPLLDICDGKRIRESFDLPVVFSDSNQIYGWVIGQARANPLSRDECESIDYLCKLRHHLTTFDSKAYDALDSSNGQNYVTSYVGKFGWLMGGTRRGFMKGHVTPKGFSSVDDFEEYVNLRRRSIPIKGDTGVSHHFDPLGE